MESLFKPETAAILKPETAAILYSSSRAKIQHLVVVRRLNNFSTQTSLA